MSPFSPAPANRDSGSRSRRNDAAAILAVWSVSVWLALFVTPHTGYASTGELFYYTLYNVAVGAFVGFRLFDRLPASGFALFAMRAAAVIVAGTLLNETVVEPFLFGSGPIDGEGLYYGAADSVWTAATFLLLRFAEWLHLGRQQVAPGSAGTAQPASGASCLFVRISGGTRRIDARDIVYLQAERDFTRIVCTNGTHFASESLKALLARSAGIGLVRVHKSFAVNIARVERLTRAEVQLGACRVPVGRRYRPAFAEAWQARSLPEVPLVVS